MAIAVGLFTYGCTTTDPEIVAIEYMRATRHADSLDALARLDLDEIVGRVEDNLTLVLEDGNSATLLRSSVETMLWGLFQETPREEDLTYDATPATIDGDRAAVEVTMRDPAGQTRKRTVHLRRTADGWRVSGRSLDNLVSYVIQRLEERF
ncbi:MAG TPA: hypothetical protein QGG47_14410 [Acidobacteriota bacterium]|nr:hypothetical protein [Acidobacteriota bacterium]